VEAKLVRKILFILIKQCLIWFLKYVLKVGSETVEFNCEKIRVGVFLCRTMNTVVLGVFYLRESLYRPARLEALAGLRTAIKENSFCLGNSKLQTENIPWSRQIN
jgi:hypothetical protein